jgi:carboxypeptidase Taq
MTSEAPAAYHDLEQRFRRMSAVGGALSVLHWDRAVMMPSGSAEDRAEQVAALEVIEHEMITGPAIADLLDAAEEERTALEPWQAANLREMRRMWTHANALPSDLVEARARTFARAEMVWREARARADFALLRPNLEEVLVLVRRSGEAKAAALGCDVYDALLDQHEPGGRAARIDVWFAELEAMLPPLLQRVMEHQARAPAPLRPDGPFAIEAQRQLGLSMMRAVGFDFERGRLDVSTHPFTGGTPGDIRITTRYDGEDFARSLMGVLHETGHAQYEAGLPRQWRGQPVGAARGMTLHESQSLLLEMQACRSREFLGWAAPRMREAFGGSGPAWEAANVHRLYTRVRPGLIRVDADEVTYPLHVILRYRLERAMVAGDLAVADLPGAWNEAMQRSLGIVPPDDAQGCLQDIHWPDGGWGYFPTYTLGAMTAAQLFAAARRADPTILSGLAAGDFAPLYAWLRANVHGKGASRTTEEIIAEATGAPLGTAAFRAHLEARYLEP